MISLKHLNKKSFATSVYLWTAMPRLGPKATELKQQLIIPKGTPKKLDAFDKINAKQIFIGMRHSAVISEAGNLFTFGSGNWGILGHGNENDVRFDKPQLVEFFQKKNLQVVDVALGEYHTVVLTSDGSVYTWGYGGKTGFFNWMYAQEVGALGHEDKKHIFVPKKVEFFAKNNIKVTKIAAGVYHTVALTEEGDIYSWGRGLYGVLGNGSNQYSLVPELNEEFKELREADPVGKKIVKIDSADEYTGALTQDGTLYYWGKNDRGQLGVGSGIGIDMIESESTPVPITIQNKAGETKKARDFSCGQNTSIIQDEDYSIYKTGLKLDYSPKEMDFFPEFSREDVSQMACGRKHYVVLNKHNQMLAWGNVFKQKAEKESEGFGLYFADQLFDGGKVKELSMRYQIFGALVENK